jgi:SAM-dependent methyltransferase
MLTAVEDPKAIVRRGYDRVSRAYRADDAEDGEYSPWLDDLERRLVRGAAVLDVGCGSGVPVARRLSQRYSVTGVDISPVQIERARELVPNATFICADVSALRFPAQSYDAVVCFFALIHLPLAEQPPLLRAIATWLRPGGIFMATVGHRAWTGIEKDWLGVEGGDMWWSHADTRTYRQWLMEAGFAIESEVFVPEGAGGHTLIVATV